MAQDERITESILIEALASEHKVDKSKISLKDWSSATGSGVADNCEMLAIKGEAVVDGKSQAFDYMAKVEPVSTIRKQMLKAVSSVSANVTKYSVRIALLSCRWNLVTRNFKCMMTFCQHSMN